MKQSLAVAIIFLFLIIVAAVVLYAVGSKRGWLKKTKSAAKRKQDDAMAGDKDASRSKSSVMVPASSATLSRISIDTVSVMPLKDLNTSITGSEVLPWLAAFRGSSSVFLQVFNKDTGSLIPGAKIDFGTKRLVNLDGASKLKVVAFTPSKSRFGIVLPNTRANNVYANVAEHAFRSCLSQLDVTHHIVDSVLLGHKETNYLWDGKTDLESITKATDLGIQTLPSMERNGPVYASAIQAQKQIVQAATASPSAISAPLVYYVDGGRWSRSVPPASAYPLILVSADRSVRRFVAGPAGVESELEQIKVGYGRSTIPGRKLLRVIMINSKPVFSWTMIAPRDDRREDFDGPESRRIFEPLHPLKQNALEEWCTLFAAQSGITDANLTLWFERGSDIGMAPALVLDASAPFYGIEPPGAPTSMSYTTWIQTTPTVSSLLFESALQMAYEMVGSRLSVDFESKRYACVICDGHFSDVPSLRRCMTRISACDTDIDPVLLESEQNPSGILEGDIPHIRLKYANQSHLEEMLKTLNVSGKAESVRNIAEATQKVVALITYKTALGPDQIAAHILRSFQNGYKVLLLCDSDENAAETSKAIDLIESKEERDDVSVLRIDPRKVDIHKHEKLAHFIWRTILGNSRISELPGTVQSPLTVIVTEGTSSLMFESVNASYAVQRGKSCAAVHWQETASRQVGLEGILVV